MMVSGVSILAGRFRDLVMIVIPGSAMDWIGHAERDIEMANASCWSNTGCRLGQKPLQ